MSDRKRAPPHCTVCKCPNITKRTCKHCWDKHACMKEDCPNKCRVCHATNRCQQFECKMCKELGINRGSVVSEEKCKQCNHTSKYLYQNGYNSPCGCDIADQWTIEQYEVEIEKCSVCGHCVNEWELDELWLVMNDWI